MDRARSSSLTGSRWTERKYNPDREAYKRQLRIESGLEMARRQELIEIRRNAQRGAVGRNSTSLRAEQSWGWATPQQSRARDACFVLGGVVARRHMLHKLHFQSCVGLYAIPDVLLEIVCKYVLDPKRASEYFWKGAMVTTSEELRARVRQYEPALADTLVDTMLNSDLFPADVYSHLFGAEELVKQKVSEASEKRFGDARMKIKIHSSSGEFLCGFYSLDPTKVLGSTFKRSAACTVQGLLEIVARELSVHISLIKLWVGSTCLDCTGLVSDMIWNLDYSTWTANTSRELFNVLGQMRTLKLTLTTDERCCCSQCDLIWFSMGWWCPGKNCRASAENVHGAGAR